MIDPFVPSKTGQTDAYPVQCRACGDKTELVLRWNTVGEVRKAWDGVGKARVNLRQPRMSTGQCGQCGSNDLAIGAVRIA
ncbi:hypothetical protein [Brevundimonas variabilis]|uniref:Uncharacterized protein n=1 Tax=Brevundimonas variabilis TaxID=74312 RepID=A0A7W9CJ76_9CAUL|nr:hypothetical protein [Brevundimonas variabilis]MBB5746690.1 hypothetical protein [Brevundimonas variabilis]